MNGALMVYQANKCKSQPRWWKCTRQTVACNGAWLGKLEALRLH